VIESEGSEGAHGHVVCDQAPQKIATIDWLTEEGTAFSKWTTPGASKRAYPAPGVRLRRTCAFPDRILVSVSRFSSTENRSNANR
jgi:hypothetical protein